MSVANSLARCVVLLVCMHDSIGFGQASGKAASGAGTAAIKQYADGPLTITDFRGRPTGNERAVVPGATLTAYTYTEVRYDTRYVVKGAGSRWTARLTSAKASAIMHRDRSWILDPDDQELLDHEQGHFDAAQILAVQVQERIDALRKQRQFVGSGATPDAAQRDLDSRLKRELQPLLDSHERVQREYDVATHHGRNRDAQMAYRARQRGQLAP